MNDKEKDFLRKLDIDKITFDALLYFFDNCKDDDNYFLNDNLYRFHVCSKNEVQDLYLAVSEYLFDIEYVVVDAIRNKDTDFIMDVDKDIKRIFQDTL